MGLTDRKIMAAQEISDYIVEKDSFYMPGNEQQLIEYMSHNIREYDELVTLESYNYRDSDGEVKTVTSRVIVFDKDSDNPYACLKVNGGFVYRPWISRNILEDLDNETETISFSNAGYSINKNLINRDWVIAENYHPRNYAIRTTIVNKDSYRSRVVAYNDSHCSKKLNSNVVSFVHGLIGYSDIRFVVEATVREIRGILCYVIITKPSIGECEVETIPHEEGMSLYSVYYDFMVRNGFFTDDDQYRKNGGHN